MNRLEIRLDRHGRFRCAVLDGSAVDDAWLVELDDSGLPARIELGLGDTRIELDRGSVRVADPGSITRTDAHGRPTCVAGTEIEWSDVGGAHVERSAERPVAFESGSAALRRVGQFWLDYERVGGVDVIARVHHAVVQWSGHGRGELVPLRIGQVRFHWIRPPGDPETTSLRATSIGGIGLRYDSRGVVAGTIGTQPTVRLELVD